MVRNVTSLLFLAFLTLSVGCGSVSNNTPSSPTPTPVVNPTPSPTPTASPTPTPTPTPSAASDSFLTTMFLEEGRNPSAVGTVTFDAAANNGNGSIQLTGIGVTNTTLIMQFCPYPQAFNGCFNVTSLTTDANGKANVALAFPQKGAFSGTFRLLQTNTAELASTATSSIGTSFRSALLPAATITGGIQQTTGNATGSGTSVVTGTTAHITLTGTTANHTFTTAVCSLFLQTACAPLANLATDAQGNASADVGTVQPAGWSIFRVSDADGVEFVTAFRVQ